jgi:hypothetical protein
MNSNRVSVSVLALVVAGGLVLGACGGDDDNSGSATPTTATPTTLTAAGLRKQASSVCDSFDADIGAVFGSLPDKPTHDQAQEAAGRLAQLIGREVDSLATLSPPAELANKYDAMVSAARKGVAAIETQGAAFFESNDNPLADAERLADELGITACASKG